MLAEKPIIAHIVVIPIIRTKWPIIITTAVPPSLSLALVKTLKLIKYSITLRIFNMVILYQWTLNKMKVSRGQKAVARLPAV